MRKTDKVVGFRETVKMIRHNRVDNIILAEDTDKELLDELELLAKINNVEIVKVSSKAKLGQSYGIERPAAVVAFLKDSSVK